MPRTHSRSRRKRRHQNQSQPIGFRVNGRQWIVFSLLVAGGLLAFLLSIFPVYLPPSRFSVTRYIKPEVIAFLLVAIAFATMIPRFDAILVQLFRQKTRPSASPRRTHRNRNIQTKPSDSSSPE